MKVEVNSIEEKKEEIQYPCIMISKKTGLIALFFEKEKGTALNNEGGFKIGEYYTLFGMDNFELFKGTITLSND